MPNFIGSFCFRIEDRGWQETFYFSNPGNATALLNTLLAPISVLSPNGVPGLAVYFRHPAVVLQSLRVRNVANTRDGKVKRLDLSSTLGTLTIANGQSVPNVAARVTIHSTNGPDRRLWMRGLRSQDVNLSGITGASLPGILVAPVNAYLQAILTAGGCIRQLAAAPSPPNVPPGSLDWNTVSAFSAHPTNPLWTRCYVSMPSNLFPIGTFVYFRGLPNPTMLYLRGRFRVVGTDGSTYIDVPGQWRGAVGTATAPVQLPAQNCQVRQSFFVYPSMSTWDQPVFSAHDTGGPTIRVRGRRSPVIRRRSTLAGA